jgi:Cysteine-rich CWC
MTCDATGDTSRCPLCGEPNGCGVAQGKPDCWCVSTPIPPDVLARVPEDRRNVACVCRTCAEAARREADALVKDS